MKKFNYYIIAYILLLISLIFDRQIILFITSLRINVLNTFMIAIDYATTEIILFIIITLILLMAKKYKEILKADGKEGWSLRFGERAAGCSGFEYFLDYSEKSGKDDMVLESEGIQIHIHKQSKDRLMGSTIDYVDGLQGAGFKITNPNVKASCGCGSSHGY